MKVTEYLAMVCLGAAVVVESKPLKAHPGVRFISDLQYDADSDNVIQSLAEAAEQSSYSDQDIESWVQAPQSLTQGQISAYADHMNALNEDPEKVFGVT